MEMTCNVFAYLRVAWICLVWPWPGMLCSSLVGGPCKGFVTTGNILLPLPVGFSIWNSDTHCSYLGSHGYWPTVCVVEIAISLEHLAPLVAIEIDLECVLVKSHKFPHTHGSLGSHWYWPTVCLGEIPICLGQHGSLFSPWDWPTVCLGEIAIFF